MVSRTRVLVIFTALSLSIMLAIGCTPAQQPVTPGGEVQTGRTEAPPSVTMEVAGQRGGKFTFTDPGVGVAFGSPNDPHLVITGSGRVYSVPATNGLLTRDIYDPNLKIIPELFEKWEISKDGLTYTFKVRQGVKFHNVPPVNGREFTSEDAKYTLLRITADPSVVSEKNKPRFQRRLDFGSIKSIDAPDKYTLVVNLKEPYAPFMDAISHPGTVAIPKEFVDKFEGGFILEGMVGTGAFMPTEYRHQQLAAYKKNPDYWKKDSKGGALPYLDEVQVLHYADVQTALSAFRSRQLDSTIGGGITKGVLASLNTEMPGVRVLSSPAANITQYRFNMKFKPFQDVRVRRAIHLALDRHQMLEIIAEGKGVVAGPVTPLFKDVSNTMDWLLQQPGYRKDKKQDIEEAKRLLKEAGYGDGLAINAMFLTGTAGADYAALLADQLKAINVTVKSEQVDYAGVWIPRSVNQEFELSWMGHVYNLDADSVLSAHLHTSGGRNYGKFNDPKLDEMIDKQRTVVDPEERRKWAQEAEKYLLETVPIAFLFAGETTLLAQPWAHNMTVNLISGGAYNSFEYAWMDKH